MREFIDPQYRTQFDEYLHEIERTGEAHGVIAVVTRTGERRFWEYSNTLRTEGMDAPVVRGIAHDVTDRVLVERSLRETNEKLRQDASELDISVRELKLFRTLLDQSNDAIVVADATTLDILDVNEKACSELGYTPKELLGMTIYDINPSVDRQAVSEGMSRSDRRLQGSRRAVGHEADHTAIKTEAPWAPSFPNLFGAKTCCPNIRQMPNAMQFGYNPRAHEPRISQTIQPRIES